MATVPCIVEPPSPKPASLSLTPGTTRSRLHFLFGWGRSSSGSQRSKPQTGDENPFVAPSTCKPDSRIIHSSQSRSEPGPPVAPARSNTLHRPRSRKQQKIVTDPPPLAQVHGHALLHASLEAPVSYWEKPRSRRPSLSSGTAALRNIAEDTIEVKRSHRKTDSGQSCCSTKGKNFFLIHGPYVLQYDGESEGDALPEKIFVLDKDSVVGVCDGVPGRPWVLQISKRSYSATKSQAPTLRPSWSRLTLRQAEDKRTVNNLLLIFDDSEDLYTWLHAIRKEIEHLGGMECDLETDEGDQSWRDDLAKKYASSADSESDSDKKSTSRTLSPITSPLMLNVSARPTLSTKDRPQSTESATSSKKTSTSLDRLRDSVTSHSYASTLATSSGYGSAPSTSPTAENFPSIRSVTDHPANDLYLRSYSPKTGFHQRPASSSAPGRSILERRKLSVDSLHLSQPEELRARKIALHLPSPISASPIDLPPQPAQTLPSFPGRTNDASIDRVSSTITTKSSSSRDDLRASGSEHRNFSRKESLPESAGGLPKGRYSLFPARNAAEPKPEITKKSAEPIQQEASSSQPRKSVPNTSENTRLAPKHGKSQSRTITLELRQHRISTLLAAGEYDLPQRSPAVTDDMIMSNFGIAGDDPPKSPLPDIKVPGLGDLNMDLEFLKAPYRVPHKQGSASEARRSSGAKSYSGSQSTKAPAGPPPLAPLPAVPSGSRRSFRSQRSSQQSQSSQHDSAKFDARIHTETERQRTIGPEAPINIVPPSYDSTMSEPRQRHRRTISSSLDGPFTPSSLSSRPQSRTGEGKSRSRSRGRRKSNKQQG